MQWTLATRLGLALAVTATLATRLAFGLADPRALIAADVFQDDAFYYLTISRNIVEGVGMTFDGETPTNAFHPLYLGLLLPIQWWSGAEPWLPVPGAAQQLCAVDVIQDGLTRRAAWLSIVAGAKALVARLQPPGVAVVPCVGVALADGVNEGLSLCSRRDGCSITDKARLLDWIGLYMHGPAQC